MAMALNLPTVRAVKWPGLAEGIYHLPGIGVTAESDVETALDSNIHRFSLVDKPKSYTGECLHLLLIVGAMIARHAAGLPMGSVAIRKGFDNGAAVFSTLTTLGQHGVVKEKPVPPCVHVSGLGLPSPGAIYASEEGVTLSATGEVREIVPRDFLVYCVRQGLRMAAAAQSRTKPSVDILSAEGAKLLELHQPKLPGIRLDLLGHPNLCRMLRSIGDKTAEAFRYDLQHQAYAFQPQEWKTEPGYVYQELNSATSNAMRTNGHTLFIKEADLKRILLLYYKTEMPLGVGPKSPTEM